MKKDVLYEPKNLRRLSIMIEKITRDTKQEKSALFKKIKNVFRG